MTSQKQYIDARIQYYLNSEFNPFKEIELLDNNLKGKKVYKTILLSKLRDLIYVDRNEDELNAVLTLIGEDGIDKDYTMLFCELLKSDWHSSHEDIVFSFLDELADNDSVETLHNTALLEESNLEDEPVPLAQKCIWALKKIGTKQALLKLESLKKSSNEMIREASTIALNNNLPN